MAKLSSFASRLEEQLESIEGRMMELLDASIVVEWRNDPNSLVFFIGPRWRWGESDQHQKRLQMELRESYLRWIEQFRLLFNNVSAATSKEIDDADAFVRRWIDKESDWSISPSTQENKDTFKEKIRTFNKLLAVLAQPAGLMIIVVPDTNALITEPDLTKYHSVAGQREYTVTILPTVLAELDHLKIQHRDAIFRKKVASVIRRLKGLRRQGSLLTGVTVNRTITVRMLATEPDFSKTLGWLVATNEDDRIIASVLEVQRGNPTVTVILVTGDINLQNKAEMANLPYSELPTRR